MTAIPDPFAARDTLTVGDASYAVYRLDALGADLTRHPVTIKVLLECGPEALRAQKALLRQWEELPLKESVDLSIGIFGQSFLTGEPQRLMQGFIDRKR